MPVNTWIRKAKNVALPKTYIHPPPGGTGWRMSGAMTLDASVLASNHSQAFFRNRMRSGDGRRGGQNLDLPVIDAHAISDQRPGRRTGGDRAVLVVDSTVAGAHEQLGRLDPPHRTSQMSAVDGKSHK